MQDVFKPFARFAAFVTVGGALIAAPMLAGQPIRTAAGEQVASHDRLLVRYEATALMDIKVPVALASVAERQR